ncbi:MAG: ABC transporter permease, partial [Chloroflexi bacterium]|nr:ABC transporter permease [Chloroflexota bacterium]
MSTLDTTERPETQSLWRMRLANYRTITRRNIRLFAEARIGLLGLFIIGIFGIMAVLHPILLNTVWDPVTYDPVTGFEFEIFDHPSRPSSAHWLGTDPVGRDVLSQLMFGARGSFVLGGVAAVVTVVIATTVGAVSAYFGKWVDAFLMRIADVVIMMPAISLLVVLGALWDLDFWKLAIIIGVLSGFGATSVIIKSQAITITVKPYIEAARGAGGSNFHIITAHIIPNLLPLAFLYMMFTVTSAIFGEAILSFFGILNIRMSWGIMIHTAQSGGYLLSG